MVKGYTQFSDEDCCWKLDEGVCIVNSMGARIYVNVYGQSNIRTNREADEACNGKDKLSKTDKSMGKLSWTSQGFRTQKFTGYNLRTHLLT